jgi:hypothetical protein
MHSSNLELAKMSAIFPKVVILRPKTTKSCFHEDYMTWQIMDVDVKSVSEMPINWVSVSYKPERIQN